MNLSVPQTKLVRKMLESDITANGKKLSFADGTVVPKDCFLKKLARRSLAVVSNNGSWSLTKAGRMQFSAV
jgi:hypothetical protein